MKRYKCTVAYIGKNYAGWQSQRNGLSVQEKIEEVLHRLTNDHIVITVSGRTDAGVNAKGQVFHFDTKLEMKPRKWMGALNGFLPDDIHIMAVEEVDVRFHARYCVRFKQYDYRINLGPYNVFNKDYAYQMPIPLDVEKMQEAAQYLIGTHDFTSFNSSSLKEYPDQVRTIRDICFEREGDVLKISFIGKGFLRYMVRMMSAQLMDVGKGKIQPEDIRKMMDARSKTAAARNAGPNGLTLQYVDYFDILALNEDGMVREYLMEDAIPEGEDLAELENRCKSKTLPLRYIFTTRHSQQEMGYHIIKEQGKADFHVRDEESYRIAESLNDQLEDWLKTRLAGEWQIRMIRD
jgi:tRNA pseudouridine38-40 synthase